jgi:hypothetical protein
MYIYTGRGHLFEALEICTACLAEGLACLLTNYEIPQACDKYAGKGVFENYFIHYKTK